MPEGVAGGTGAIRVIKRRREAKYTDKMRRGEKGHGAARRRTRLTALRRLLPGNCLLFAHGRDDGDQEILALIESTLNLGTHVTLGDLDIVLRSTILSHQVQEAVIDVDLERGVMISLMCTRSRRGGHPRAGTHCGRRWEHPRCG